MSVQVHINNLEVLLAAVDAQPVTMFDLTHYQQKTQCGTLYCTVGLATTVPHFQQLGFRMAVDKLNPETSRCFTGVKVNDNWIFDEGVVRQHFGSDFDSLFSPAGCGSLDDDLGYLWDDDTNEANMTDKELAVARLVYVIEKLKEQA